MVLNVAPNAPEFSSGRDAQSTGWDIEMLVVSPL
jgi:hypothetical protein